MPSKKGKRGKGVNTSISTPPSSLFTFTSPSSSSSSLPSSPKSAKESKGVGPVQGITLEINAQTTLSGVLIGKKP